LLISSNAYSSFCDDLSGSVMTGECGRNRQEILSYHDIRCRRLPSVLSCIKKSDTVATIATISLCLTVNQDDLSHFPTGRAKFRDILATGRGHNRCKALQGPRSAQSF
jgi:hypothetical protein